MMRTRPGKHVREALKDNIRLADLVLRGDHAEARREAERVKELQRQREQRAEEFRRRETQRYWR